MTGAFRDHRRVLVLLGSAVLLLGMAGAIVWGVSPRMAKGPRLELPEHPLDFGEGRPGELLDGSFTIRNKGAAPLTFSISASCSCSSLNPRQGEIPPYGVQDIHVGIRLVEEDVTKHITLQFQTNDPACNIIAFSVLANCPPLLRVSPTRISFDNVEAGTERSQTISVAGPDGEPLKPPMDVVIAYSSPYVTLDRVQSDHRTLTFLARLSARTPVGPIRDVVTLKLKGEDRTVSVPRSGRGVGESSRIPQCRVYVDGPANRDPARLDQLSSDR